MAKLHASMSVEEFDDGYFHAADLKAFARQLGIPVGRRRKLELESLIRGVLRTGMVPLAKPGPDRRSGQERDRLAAENGRPGLRRRPENEGLPARLRPRVLPRG